MDSPTLVEATAEEVPFVVLWVIHTGCPLTALTIAFFLSPDFWMSITTFWTYMFLAQLLAAHFLGQRGSSVFEHGFLSKLKMYTLVLLLTRITRTCYSYCLIDMNILSVQP